MGAEFDLERFNQGFRCMMNGAELLALQRNPYWDAGERGLQLDAGALVAALEFATGRTARVVGKPCRDFFELAIADLGLSAGEVLVVGDDLLNDGIGGNGAGCRTAMVLTGKFRGEEDLGQGEYRPDLIAGSVAEIF
jgi:ribonucleotide monophosphatase NagD (HAD superfamily)